MEPRNAAIPAQWSWLGLSELSDANSATELVRGPLWLCYAVRIVFSCSLADHCGDSCALSVDMSVRWKPLACRGWYDNVRWCRIKSVLNRSYWDCQPCAVVMTHRHTELCYSVRCYKSCATAYADKFSIGHASAGQRVIGRRRSLGTCIGWTMVSPQPSRGVCDFGTFAGSGTSRDFSFYVWPAIPQFAETKGGASTAACFTVKRRLWNNQNTARRPERCAPAATMNLL